MEDQDGKKGGKKTFEKVSTTTDDAGGEQNKNHAPAGNRTRVCTVAGYYSTTRPLVLCFLRCILNFN